MPDSSFEHSPFGPWEAYNEEGDDPKSVVAGLNVRLEGGEIRRRNGRQLFQASYHAWQAAWWDAQVVAVMEHVAVSDRYRQLLAVYRNQTTGDYRWLKIDPSGNWLPDGVYGDLDEPDAGGLSIEPASKYRSVPYKGHTIIADRYGRLLDYNGSTLKALDAVQGLDAELPGGRTYLSAPPRATMLTVWRNRLVAIYRQTVGLSASSSDAMIPSTAKASGASMWPSATNFDAMTQAGDEVMGVAILNDRLVLPTRRGIVEVDEDLGSPIARERSASAGCLAPDSVQTCGEMVIYLGDGKVYAYNGEGVSDLSGPMSDTLANVNWALASRAVSTKVTRRGEYWLWLPVYGEAENNVLLIFDYHNKVWQPPQSAWYPFDKVSRNGRPDDFRVWSACTCLSQAGVEYVLTGNSSCELWIEDVTETDGTSIFPAYAGLGRLGEGERIYSWGDMRTESRLDGAHVNLIALDHGDDIEQDLVAMLDGVSTMGQVVYQRLLRATGQETWSSVAAWPVQPNDIGLGRRKFSLRARSARLQLCFHLPGTHGGVDDPAPGGIMLLESSGRERKGAGRGGT